MVADTSKRNHYARGKARHAVTRELLEAVDNDRTDFRWVLALLVVQARADVESLP
jgi:hypothetical protein